MRAGERRGDAMQHAAAAPAGLGDIGAQQQQRTQGGREQSARLRSCASSPLCLRGASCGRCGRQFLRGASCGWQPRRDGAARVRCQRGCGKPGGTPQRRRRLWKERRCGKSGETTWPADPLTGLSRCRPASYAYSSPIWRIWSSRSTRARWEESCRRRPRERQAHKDRWEESCRGRRDDCRVGFNLEQS